MAPYYKASSVALIKNLVLCETKWSGVCVSVCDTVMYGIARELSVHVLHILLSHARTHLQYSTKDIIRFWCPMFSQGGK